MSSRFQKLASAIHHICARATNEEKPIDDVQLNKTLWYADVLAYLIRGESITGTTYKKKRRGPVASGHAGALNQLIENRQVKDGYVPLDGGGFFKTLDSIADPQDFDFSARELIWLDTVQDYVSGLKPSAISEQSHGDIWELAADGEPMPLFTIYAERLGAPTPQDIEAALAAP